MLDDKFRKLELFHSILTAKRKIVYNSETLTEEDGTLFDNEFSYSFKLNGHKMKIVQQQNTVILSVFYKLTIDGITFEQLMIDGKIEFINILYDFI